MWLSQSTSFCFHIINVMQKNATFIFECQGLGKFLGGERLFFIPLEI